MGSGARHGSSRTHGGAAGDPAASQRYVGNLREQGTRALRSDELARLRRREAVSGTEAVRAFALLAVATAALAVLGDALTPLPSLVLGGRAGAVLAAAAVAGIVDATVIPRAVPLLRPWVRSIALGTIAVAIPAAMLASLLPLPWTLVLARSCWLMVVLFGAGLGAVAIAARLRVLARRSLLRRDLDAAVVHRFAAAGSVAADPRELELLPRSGVVLTRDGRAMRGLGLAQIAEVAPAQPHAFRTALPRGLLRVHDDARVSLQRRSLSPGEHLEIDAHIARLRRAARPALAAVAAAALVLLGRLLADPDWRTLVDPVALGWYALAAVGVLGLLRRLGAARKLSSDLALRWVVTVADSKAGPAGVPRLEVLPVSHLAWTEDQEPAAWRLHRT
jgi:hypothetical protein